MTPFLADFMISGDWLVGALVILIPVIIGAWFKGKQSGVKEATNNITIADQPVNVRTQEATRFAENAALLAHEDRTAQSLKQVADDIDQIHTRLNSAFRKLDTLDGSVDGIRENVGKLLDLALNLPQGTSASRTRKPRPGN